MSVLLIQLPFWTNKDQEYAIKCISTPNLGIGYLTSMLLQSCINTKIIGLSCCLMLLEFTTKLQTFLDITVHLIYIIDNSLYLHNIY